MFEHWQAANFSMRSSVLKPLAKWFNYNWKLQFSQLAIGTQALENWLKPIHIILGWLRGLKLDIICLRHAEQHHGMQVGSHKVSSLKFTVRQPSYLVYMHYALCVQLGLHFPCHLVELSREECSISWQCSPTTIGLSLFCWSLLES